MGVRRLTGMNSDAINIAAHIAMEPTAAHICRFGMDGWLISVDIQLPHFQSPYAFSRTNGHRPADKQSVDDAVALIG
jgi:hypothetical protein